MAYQLTIQPSGLICDAKAYDTLLDSAIAAGVNFPMDAKMARVAAVKARLLAVKWIMATM